MDRLTLSQLLICGASSGVYLSNSLKESLGSSNISLGKTAPNCNKLSRNTIGKWITTKSVNFSNGGICMENAGHVAEGENLYLRLHVPISSVPIECPPESFGSGVKMS